jgi:hypothetical protein
MNADARSLAIGMIVVSSVAEVAARGMTTRIRAAFYLVLALVVVAGVAAVYSASGIYQLDHINHDESVEMVCPLLRSASCAGAYWIARRRVGL